MDYGLIALAFYGLVALVCIIVLLKIDVKGLSKRIYSKILVAISYLLAIIPMDLKTENNKSLSLFILGIFLLIAGGCINGITGAILTFLGLFSFYALIRDLSPTVNGISFPNAYKIVLAIIGFFTVIVIMTGLVQMSWAENSAEYVGAIFDGITDLIDTFLTNLEPIKDFLEWWFEFSAPVAVGGGL